MKALGAQHLAQTLRAALSGRERHISPAAAQKKDSIRALAVRQNNKSTVALAVRQNNKSPVALFLDDVDAGRGGSVKAANPGDLLVDACFLPEGSFQAGEGQTVEATLLEVKAYRGWALGSYVVEMFCNPYA